ncbi:NUDIX domain-containing protein [Curtobacterium sp. 458]|uniref:NUDIX domain-containing protein n=1 Tax=Curtobacterium sp. 458 TaxID=3050069 RepID=UPI0025B40CBF|nr:NUDIX domain-containing protein [Curtobacterium sp. 458]WJY01189.1 NUDIX domain-containing protein [Curtobacterium sp. 458]
MSAPRPLRLRAAAVAVRDGRVLVVLRERDGRRYAVLPGGGVEQGETPQRACLRELREETGLDGEVVALLPVGLERAAPAVYLHVEAGPGVPALATDAPERAGASPTNRYRPAWVPIADVEAVGLVPPLAVDAVRMAVSAGRSPGAAPAPTVRPPR